MEVIESKWYKKDGASSASIDDVEKLLNTTLPNSTKVFCYGVMVVRAN